MSAQIPQKSKAGLVGLAFGLTTALLEPAGAQAAAPDGETVYRQSCAACHESGENRAPSFAALRRLSTEAILESLTSGTMAYVGETLPTGHADAVASFLGRGTGTVAVRARRTCPEEPWPDPFAGPRWLGWGGDLGNTRHQSADFAGLDADSVSGLGLKWAFGLPDADRARAQPAVAGGRVFLGARNGRLYALDAKSGCAIWEFKARAEVRTAVLVSPTQAAGRNAVYFGDIKANLYAVDAATGRQLWRTKVDDHEAATLTGSPVLFEGRLYVATSSIEEFTGASPILVELPEGQRLLIAGQKSGMVHAVDPDQEGAIAWQRRAGKGGMLGGIQFGPAADFRNAYVAVSDYRGAGSSEGGGITAFCLSDGQIVWHAPGIPCPAGREGCSSAQSAAVTAIPGVVFSGSLDGFLRAYSTEDGSVLWSYDTVREYSHTVNGVPATGGSLNGPGPAVVEGMVYVNSGYGQFGSIPGNAFLAFVVIGE